MESHPRPIEDAPLDWTETEPGIARPVPEAPPFWTYQVLLPKQSQARPGSTTAPVRVSEARTWIEIRLVGEDDQPIPGERFRIKTPDGKIVEGKLGSSGMTRVDDLPEGECQITFPDLDAEAWEPIQG